MLRRARAAGVAHLLTVGVDQATSAAAVQLAARRRGLRAAVGIHPNRLTGVEPAAALAWLEQLASAPGVVAVGEVGLDESSSASLVEQLGYFEGCLDLAARRGLAVALHVVGLHDATLESLSRAPGPPMIVHYFQGDGALAERYLARGCVISVGRPVTRAENAALRAAVQAAPLDRLLLETDTYPLPGRTTEPRDVADVCRAVAELKGLSYNEVARTTTGTYLRLVGDNRATSA